MITVLAYHSLTNTWFYTSSTPKTYQIVLATAHPAKFSEAVSRALEGTSNFEFDRDVLPTEFQGLLQKERRVIQVDRAEVELVKQVIEDVAQKNS